MAKYPESLDEKPSPQRTRGWWRLLGRYLSGLSIVLMATMLFVVVFWPRMVITVPSGQVGVLWKRFNHFQIDCWCWIGRGTVLAPRDLKDEGLHLIWPWDRLFIYDLRLQSVTETYNAISKDGVSVTLQLNIRFQLLHNAVAVLHKFIGPQYLASVISPEIGSQARQVVSQYTAQEVYTSREAIERQIRDNAVKSLSAHLNDLVQTSAIEQPDPQHYTQFLQPSIQVLDTLVLSIELPPAIMTAINRQTEQYYMIQEYKYRVAREAEESKRKQIEADGIAAFQQTVSKGISDSYLRWRGIEATLALAQSPNAKIVVIGAGKNGLPIILGNVDSPVSPGPGPKPAEGSETPGPVTSPAPTGDTPADTSSTTPTGSASMPADTETLAPGSAPPNVTQAAGTPTAPKNKPAAEPSTASSDKQPSSSISLDLAAIKAILSRISEGLRPSGSATSSGTEAKPEH